MVKLLKMKYVTLLIVVLFPFLSRAQRRMEFMPKQNLWHVQTLDPNASQSSAMCVGYWIDKKPADFLLTAFAFGFQRAFFAWPVSDDKGYDLGLEGAALTNFEWTNRNGTIERNNLSTDFWIGVPFVIHFRPWTVRIRFYHLSSHMGDDYMIRNNITSYFKNNANYEQLDVTVMRVIKNFRFYAGTGLVVHSALGERKPLSFTFETDYLLILNREKSCQFYAGLFVSSKQAFGFTPAFNVGTGLQLGKPDRLPVKILVTYFNGPLPYSVYEGKPVQWLGASIYIPLF